MARYLTPDESKAAQIKRLKEVEEEKKETRKGETAGTNTPSTRSKSRYSTTRVIQQQTDGGLWEPTQHNCDHQAQHTYSINSNRQSKPVARWTVLKRLIRLPKSFAQLAISA